MTTESTGPPSRDSEDMAIWTPIFAAWLVAATSTLGALFFSLTMHLPPCDLCWYQRIFMFPLAVILPIGLFPLDLKVTRYALPLAGLGWLIALFHQLLVAGWIPKAATPCAQGIPCSETVVRWFGFLTIPILSLAAFSLIVALLVIAQFRSSR